MSNDSFKFSIFFEIVNNLLKTLHENNISYEFHLLNPNIIHTFDPDKLYIMYGVEDFINYPKKFICMQFEQLDARIYHLSRDDPENFKKYILDKFKKALYIVDYSYKNIDFLKENNILNTLIMPYAYTSNLSLNENLINVSEREIDILWYGNKNKRRNNILEKMKKIKVNISSSKLWDEFDFTKNIIYPYKTNTIKNSKIVLNIKYDEPLYSIIETPRIIHAISNGCLVISESSSDCKLNAELKENIVICHHSQIEDMCLFYLANQDLLQKKIEKTTNWLRNKYKYKIPNELLILFN